MDLTSDELRHHYGFILSLLSLIALIIVPSFWQPHQQIVSAILLIIMMLAFLSLVAKKPFELILGGTLAIPVLYLNIHLITVRDGQPHVIAYGLNLLFYIFICFELLRHIIRQRIVNFNIIAAAIIVYLILGLIWAFIYLIIEKQSPGAFLEATGSDTEYAFSILLYFSFVTITTLGFGDISPTTELAGKWVVLEAIIGQFYLTILVARLVGLYRSD